MGLLSARSRASTLPATQLRPRWSTQKRILEEKLQVLPTIGVDAMTLLVRAEITALTDNVESFLELARALERAAETENGTLRYEWFQGEEPGTFVVLEEYTDPGAAIVHNEHCAELLQKLPGVADMTAVQLHGQLSPEVEAWAADLPVARVFTPLSPA